MDIIWDIRDFHRQPLNGWRGGDNYKDEYFQCGARLRSRTRLQHYKSAEISADYRQEYCSSPAITSAPSPDPHRQTCSSGALNPHLRLAQVRPEEHSALVLSDQALVVQECPTSWDDLLFPVPAIAANNNWFGRELQPVPPSQIWQQLVGIANNFSRTGQTVTVFNSTKKKLGIEAINCCSWGFKVSLFRLQSQFQDRSFFRNFGTTQ